uniref:Vacuolar fusion protein MON1 homolog n=1 Tax=Melopsittacus undulatus TaxID=13146 RepID=A0A8C6JB26_MELUD
PRGGGGDGGGDGGGSHVVAVVPARRRGGRDGGGVAVPPEARVRAEREDRTLVFEQRGPLLLVSVSRTRQTAAQLRRELAFVHEQILSLLTRGGITRVFARRRGYDLRRLLAGAEAVLDRLLSGAAADGRLLLGAARCLPLAAPLRRAVSGALRRSAAAAVPAPALAVLAASGRLVTAARQRALAEGGRLCASDLHLLLNLLGSGVGAGEVWTPVCLPRFNPDGYFYAYAAALGEEEEDGGSAGNGVTLILLSTEREGFYAAAGCRRQLEEALRAQGWLQELSAAVKAGAGYSPARPGAPELRHFLYKPLEGPEEMQQLPQFTSPELEEPYSSEEEQHRLFDLYHYLHSRVHSPHRPLRLLYHVAEKETLLAWVRWRARRGQKGPGLMGLEPSIGTRLMGLVPSLRPRKEGNGRENGGEMGLENGGRRGEEMRGSHDRKWREEGTGRR